MPDKQTAPRRCLFVSSTPDPRFESLTTAEYFELKQFSIASIGYNLEKLGWQTKRIGRRSSLTPGRTARVIDAFQPHIVYTYGSLTALNPILAKRRCKWRDYRVIHGWDDDYREIWRYNYGHAARMLAAWLERAIVRRSDGVVTLSRFNQARGLEWGVVSEYIPNGFDMQKCDRGNCEIRLEGDFKLVYTGDQAPMKRAEDICRAMRELPDNIKLYFTGGHYPYLDKYASSNCIFLGFLPKNDQLCVMEQADVLVCTADQDCNAKFHEYIRFGKPILGYDGRPNMLFSNGHNALLTRDYASAIKQLYGDPTLRARLAQNAAQDIPVLAWSEIASLFDRYFDKQLAKQRPPTR
jgi:hypothetical protein